MTKEEEEEEVVVVVVEEVVVMVVVRKTRTKVKRVAWWQCWLEVWRKRNI